MGKKKKINRALELIELCKRNTQLQLKRLPLLRFFVAFFIVFLSLSVGVLSVFLYIFVSNLFIFLTFGILILGGVSLVFTIKKFALIEDPLMNINSIYLAIKHMPILYFDNKVFCGLARSNAMKITLNIIKSYGLEDSKIYEDMLVAKRSLCLTLEDAKRFFNKRLSGGKMKDDRVAIYLPETEFDFSCDNCGQNFAKGERFCSYCGTLRKDLRRRV